MSDQQIKFDAAGERIVELNKLGGYNNRFVKLQEETGELSDAIAMCDVNMVAEEGIDVLLMLQSIFADHFPTSNAMDLALSCWFDVYFGWSAHRSETLYRCNAFLFMVTSIGRAASSYQLLTDVESSRYKAKGAQSNPSDMLLKHLLDASCWVVDIITSSGLSLAEIQQLHTNKMNKWERVAK